MTAPSTLAFIPSPSSGVWALGPIPIRAYALCILLGIVVGVWIADKRWVARGGNPGFITDVTLWAVPFGIVGARLYHVCTDWYKYFGSGGLGFADSLKIWQGGLGIWGGVAGGALGAWIAVRRRGVLLPPLADTAAPALAVAQAIGRFGNWFNQELFGGPSTLPWALEIDPAKRPPGYEAFATFHPTFLYEAIWCLLVALFVIWADKRFTLGHGRAFALYAASYCVGRLGFELVRIDDATRILGIRINVFTSVIVFLGAVTYFVLSAKLRPGRETSLLRHPEVGLAGAPEILVEPVDGQLVAEPESQNGAEHVSEQ
jgi:prolipoprotein diacylglyceryl transferase